MLNNRLSAVDDFSNIFKAIDDQCQQYLFYPPISHQKAISRIRNAALILSLFAVHNPEKQNIFLNDKAENNQLSANLIFKLLQSMLATLNTPCTPFSKLKTTFKLLSSANLNPRKLLLVDEINDNPMLNHC
ncbi:MAG: hypothetical protein J6C85_04435 [Alphaproteobacteria bacterium]|nr:hypothetical protein [Alphaproteobacteria bacterium]